MIRKTFAVCIVIAAFALDSSGQTGQGPYAVSEGEILFDGYDPVTYYQGEPAKGKPSVSLDHEGRKILFASRSNKVKFAKSPEKYAPEYGGWCSIAMVKGSFVIPDYSLYKIQDDKLLFFSVRSFFNGLTAWEKSPDANMVSADKAYEGYFQ